MQVIKRDGEKAEFALTKINDVIMKAFTANYWLSEIYDEEIAAAYRNADIHIHDLSMLTGYCAGWFLKQLIKEGLGGITGKITSAPARHLSVMCNQMVNFLGIMQKKYVNVSNIKKYVDQLAMVGI